MARLRGSINNDTITGYAGQDRLWGGYGDDTLAGAGGNDRLNGGRGSDTVQGGDGNDVIISRSDAGETAIAQDINANNDPNNEVDAATRMIYANQANLSADDVLTGGAGADTFRFETLIGAKREILEKHADPNTGIIDYSMMGVAGENNLVHDHWVDGIGNDVITDFNAAEGDKIQIAGHTTEVSEIRIVDADGDGAVDDTVLQLRSNQGANGGAHNLDLLGTITVLNNQLDADDFTVDAGVNYGIVRNISQIEEAINPYNPGAATAGNGAGAGAGAGADAGAGAGDGTGAQAGGDTGASDGAGTGTGATAGGDTGAGAGTGDGASADAGSGTGTGTGSGTDAGTGAGTGSGDAAGPGILAEMFSPPADVTPGTGPTSGADVLVYGDGGETGNGGMGDDLLVGGSGDDDMSGGWGDDRVDGGDGDDHIHGNHGDDLLYGNAGDDSLRGDFGDDILLGGDGNDDLKGSRGEDVLFGGADDDILRGGAGDDALMGGAGEDRIDGGSGTDAVLLTGTLADYTVNIVDGEVQITDANNETDIITRVEQFRFLGNGETYVIENGALALTADTEDLDDLVGDHIIQEFIALETGAEPADAAAAAAGATADTGAAAAADAAAGGMAGMAGMDMTANDTLVAA